MSAYEASARRMCSSGRQFLIRNTCLGNSRLRIFGKAVAGHVAVNTGDLVQPSRQTRHSDPDFSRNTLVARTDVYIVCKSNT